MDNRSRLAPLDAIETSTLVKIISALYEYTLVFMIHDYSLDYF